MTKTDDVSGIVMELFEDAAEMTVDMRNDQDYDLAFLSDKLKLATIFQERLSDISMKLTKIALEVTKAARGQRRLLDRRTLELKGGQDYHDKPLNEKGLWLDNQLSSLREETESWEILSKVVSEVREAVTERAATMKRLDSDIRLHTKLFEVGVAARGAGSPSSYTGNRTSEIDIT